MDFNKFVKKTKINGVEFQINKLGALKAFSMGKSLLKVVAPLFGGTLDGMRGGDYYEPPRTFTQLALTLCDQIDKVEIEEILVELLSGATRNGVEIKDLNDNTQIDLNELIELFAFALKENFGELFTGKGIAAQLQNMLMALTKDDGLEKSDEQ